MQKVKYNERGNLHSYNDKPAVSYSDGTKYWYYDGVLHRENGPAIVYSNDEVSFYYHGENLKFSEWVKLVDITEEKATELFLTCIESEIKSTSSYFNHI